MVFSFNPGLRRQLLAGVAASMGAFCSASLYGWIAPILPHLLSKDSEIPMTDQEASWMIAGPTITNLITPIPSGMLSDRIGRKTVMALSAPFYTLGWVIILYYRNYVSLLVARCIQEAIIGIVFTVTPVYLGEIASKDFRGTITSLFFISYWIGLEFEYCLGPFLPFVHFTSITLVTSVIYCLACWYLPESPYFLLMKDREKEALDSLVWLRASTEDTVKEEFKVMVETSKRETATKRDLRDLVATPTDRKALNLLLFVGALRIFSGTMPIIAYATQIFNISSNGTLDAKYITIIFGFVFLLGSCFSSYALDVFGRRPLLIWSSLLTSISLFVVGIIYYLKYETEVDVSSYTWLVPVSTMVYAAVVVAGLFPVNIAYTSELFTNRTRSVASAISTELTVFLIMIELKLYQDFIDHLGVYFNFFLFGGLCLLGTVVTYLYMPETKHKTFEQIRLELIKGVKK